jgi:hypothetical protein
MGARGMRARRCSKAACRDEGGRRRTQRTGLSRAPGAPRRTRARAPRPDACRMRGAAPRRLRRAAVSMSCRRQRRSTCQIWRDALWTRALAHALRPRSKRATQHAGCPQLRPGHAGRHAWVRAAARRQRRSSRSSRGRSASDRCGAHPFDEQRTTTACGPTPPRRAAAAAVRRGARAGCGGACARCARPRRARRRGARLVPALLLPLAWCAP